MLSFSPSVGTMIVLNSRGNYDQQYGIWNWVCHTGDDLSW